MGAGTEAQESLKPLPVLDGEALFAVLEDLYPQATQRQEENWYIIVAISLISMGKQDMLAGLWGYIASRARTKAEGSQKPELDYLVLAARRLREGVMKGSCLFGYPRVCLFQERGGISG